MIYSGCMEQLPLVAPAIDLSPPVSRAVWGEFLCRPSHPSPLKLKHLGVRSLCLSYAISPSARSSDHRYQMRKKWEGINGFICSQQPPGGRGYRYGTENEARSLYSSMAPSYSLDIVWVRPLRIHVFVDFQHLECGWESKLLRNRPWSQNGSCFLFWDPELVSQENNLEEQAQSPNCSLASCLSMWLFSCVLPLSLQCGANY